MQEPIDSKKQIFAPEAYAHRDVMGLIAPGKWTEEETKTQLECNRVLAPDFATREPEQMVADAKVTGAEYLTDVVCPSPENELFLAVCGKVVAEYQVPEEQFDLTAHRIHDGLLSKDFSTFKTQAATKFQEKEKEMRDNGTVDALAKNFLVENNPEKDGEQDFSVDQMEASKRIVLDQEKRKFMQAEVALFISEHMGPTARDLKLEKKPFPQTGKNHDFCFLGAAGSGKSTITKQLLSESVAPETRALYSTDAYRAFVPPSEVGGRKPGKNAFVQTQDMAYMVKEVVSNNLTAGGVRPDIVVDGITLDGNIAKSLSQSSQQLSSSVTAYAPSGAVGIAERAHSRAQDTSASSADKGRYVNTQALFEGHAAESSRLLTSIPDFAETNIYDTNVDRAAGEKPKVIATVKPDQKTVTVTDVKVFSEFLNKQNINAAATHQAGLIHGKEGGLTTHPDYKAAALLALTRSPKPYKVSLKKDGIEYATLTYDSEKARQILTVTDADTFKEKASAKGSVEGQVLRAITKQVSDGDGYKFGQPEAITDLEADIKIFKQKCPPIQPNEQTEKIVEKMAPSSGQSELKKSTSIPKTEQKEQRAGRTYKNSIHALFLKK